MREYGRIYPSFWTGRTGKKIKSLGSDAQIIALYLLSSPHANMIGLYYIPIQYISHETGVDYEGSCKALLSLDSVGFCEYDQETEFVWVKKMAEYQIGKELKPNDKQVKGVINLYNSLSNNPFLDGFFKYYSKQFHMSSARAFEGA